MGKKTTQAQSFVSIVVPLEDISAVSVEHSNPIGLLIFAALQFLFFFILGIIADGEGEGLAVSIICGLFVALICVALYFKSKGIKLKVFYAGGVATINVALCPYEEVLRFEKGLLKNMRIRKGRK